MNGKGVSGNDVNSYSRHKLVHGRGINDADYIVQTVHKDGYSFTCPIYRTWRGVLDRAFSKLKSITYINTTVCPEWERFSNFKAWMMDQTYLDLEGNKLEIDKDILVKGNQEYSPDKCIFVPKRINGLLVTRGRARSKQPLGVSLRKHMKNRPYQATVRNCGKILCSPYFELPSDAHKWWQDTKAKIIRDAVESWRVNPIHGNSYNIAGARALLARADLLDFQRLNGVETKEL